ncbi:29 kDa ribonucleoprotein A, chloroplastic [Lathyrus oleraceus]|uniref:RNA-binding protein cp29b n=1 Tax=Pisum sativum TaxID=3888 RepID=A0A9D4W3X5_PEA|nr:29 kDa ribonucleoprotein A, chloroplastic [Pisum sativum]XP_050891816.1 29 kDa ribonucleoprotein A, chloroplastic [Pisum sativum]KAI5395609.1 RNA-binding protein cp29b [Pisum sativum]
MSTSATSLALPFLPTKTTLSSPLSSPLSSFSLNTTFKPFSFASLRSTLSLSTRFVSRVAVSSEFDQEEDTFEDGDTRSYSANQRLFVGNLPFSVDSAQLAEIFESAGNVEMVEVIYDKATGRSRGFGFVTMSSAAEVEAAAQQFNGYLVDGRELRVNSGPPPPPRENSRFGDNPRSGGENSRFGDSSRSRGPPRAGSDSEHRVHVGNLAWGVDNASLESLFQEQGSVIEAKVIYDRDSGRSRGFGFVTFSSAEEVNRAIQSLDGVDLKGRAIRVAPAGARPSRQF